MGQAGQQAGPPAPAASRPLSPSRRVDVNGAHIRAMASLAAALEHRVAQARAQFATPCIVVATSLGR